jgi:hypothetical protein
MNELSIVDLTMIENGIQAAEQLVHALLLRKRRLSLQPATNVFMLPSSLSAKKRRIRNKSVRFSEVPCVHVIEETDDSDLTHDRWYRKHEYNKIKEGNHKTLVAFIKANAQSKTLDEMEHCLLGLERQISILVLRMPYRNRQKKVVRSVLCLQQIQRNMKSLDAAALREMSLIVSKQDEMQALRNAMIDSH